MSKSWKLRVGAPLGGATANMPLSGSLHKLANTLTHDRVKVDPKKSTRPPSAKFSDDEVRLLRKIWAAEIATKEQLADLFDMAPLSMLHILDGTNYSKVL